eukprot:m.914820 g.914820  ORF g.914820 m.914820 type:complete len:1562 (-) comp23731_c0_seq1:248-4933(-)
MPDHGVREKVVSAGPVDDPPCISQEQIFPSSIPLVKQLPQPGGSFLMTAKNASVKFSGEVGSPHDLLQTRTHVSIFSALEHLAVNQSSLEEGFRKIWNVEHRKHGEETCRETERVVTHITADKVSDVRVGAALPGRTKSFTSFEELNSDAAAMRERSLTTILRRHCAMSDAVVVKYIVHRVLETTCGHGDAAKALREVFEDEVVNFLVRELSANNINLRVVFKNFDAPSYGKLNVQQFSGMLAHICTEQLPRAVVDFVFRCIDFGNTGAVEYDTLYNRLFRTGRQMQLRHEYFARSQRGERTIRSVVVITRHGARFPLKAFPHTVRWPKSDKFWSMYGGRLTSVGTEQLLRLGQRLRTKYITHEHLLEEQSPDMPSRVTAYASNQDRSLMSAQSLLQGLCHGASTAIIVDEDGINHEEEAQISSSCVRIYMSMDDYTPLLHGFKQNPAYTALHRAALRESMFSAWAERPEYMGVVDKLWRMTGLETIHPSLPAEHRLRHVQSVAQQINIERAHQMELLLNSRGCGLTLHDEEIINEVSAYACRLRYCGHSDTQQRTMARHASGVLPATIVREFCTVAGSSDADTGGKLTLYSAHANTIMAILAHLGFKNFPIPMFAAHLVFELHQVDGEYRVKLLYNPDPEFHGFDTEDADDTDSEGLLRPCPYVRVPPGDTVVDWASAPGSAKGVSLHEFQHTLLHARRSFATVGDWERAAWDPSTLPAHARDALRGCQGGTRRQETHLAAGDNGSTSGSHSGTSNCQTDACSRQNASDGGPADLGRTADTGAPVRGYEPQDKDAEMHTVPTGNQGSNVPTTLSAQVRLLHEFTKDVRQLKPFTQQVAGHPETFWEVGPRLLAKPVRETCHRERMFYKLLERIQVLALERTSADGIGAHADTLHALLPFLPAYYGDIFVTADSTGRRVATHALGHGTNDLHTRQYHLGVPERVNLVKDVSLASKAQGTDSVGQTLSGSGRHDTHVDMFGWVHLATDGEGTWERRWTMLQHGALHWYTAKRNSAAHGDGSLGSVDVKQGVKHIVTSQDYRVKAIQWPRVSGVGIVLIRHDGGMLGLHLDTFDDSLAWIKALRLVLYSKQRGQRALVATDKSIPPRAAGATVSADARLHLPTRPSPVQADPRRDTCEGATYDASICDSMDFATQTRAGNSNGFIGHTVSVRGGVSRHSVGDRGCHDNSIGVHASRAASPSSPLRVGFTARDPPVRDERPSDPHGADNDTPDSRAAGEPTERAQGSVAVPPSQAVDMVAPPPECRDEPAPNCVRAEGNDAPGQVCLVLENLLSAFERPCVMDIKIGTRQHADDASPEKRAKAIRRCASTTSKTLGLRCSGMRVLYNTSAAATSAPPTSDHAAVAGDGGLSAEAPQADLATLSSSLPLGRTLRGEDAQERVERQHAQAELRMWDKQYGKLLKQDTFHEALQQFFDSGSGLRTQEMHAMEQRLDKLYTALSRIEGFRFYSSSLLLIYDAAPHHTRVDVRLIDFARVQTPPTLAETAGLPPDVVPPDAGNGSRYEGKDEGALFGIRNLARIMATTRLEAQRSSSAPRQRRASWSHP